MNNISNASQYLGSSAFDDLCQAFVEQATYGHQGVYPSAISAWNSQNTKVQGSKGISPGDLVYFGADSSNNGFGHAGIYTGNNQFISATNSGVGYNDLDKWQQNTGQRLLGYIPQNQSAQSLGSNLNAQTGQIIGANGAVIKPNPVNKSSNFDFGTEMENFRNVWNQTHSTPLAAY